MLTKSERWACGKAYYLRSLGCLSSSLNILPQGQHRSSLSFNMWKRWRMRSKSSYSVMESQCLKLKYQEEIILTLKKEINIMTKVKWEEVKRMKGPNRTI